MKKALFFIAMTFSGRLIAQNSPQPAGKGGVTSQTGFTSTAPDPNWRPDLVKAEDRIIFALLFRL